MTLADLPPMRRWLENTLIMQYESTGNGAQQ
jgi:hypothetical protein